MNVLARLADYARERVVEAKRRKSLAQIREEALTQPRGEFAFEKALSKKGLSFICECKKASPSKGLIAPDFPYLQIAQAYEAAGADAISVLTEPREFRGSDRYLAEISATVNIPCLRKDFTVDAYMIYEAKVLGAAAVLLICSLLEEEEIKAYISLCDELGMSALVEAHDEAEVRLALRAGARIVGVNNRNLKDFSVDIQNSASLRDLVPPHVIFVAESGIREAADVRAAVDMGANAVLVGEALMRAGDKKEKLAAFYAAANRVKECLS
ncbi:MAG: indole-3-glycerol phosphate synthase TrpC [Selenomonas sp.]|uniref:indole-3-glycerol phosphate synthase TrpC n=1 Tax=Selenomonas sp. TaxID=2053611 RepID=UPI0025D4C9B6|nr:indole-3-glycerol phosphate synthase TrpC [Selenomonas sp.]MCR5756961.1 indole-3-glycerol phosphate synthase TrpC [Selenomonas sp.]